MSNKYNINDIQNKQYYNNQRNVNFNQEENEYICLTEEDFYPPYDNRVLKSYVEDINGGDNFADYCKYIFAIYDEEDYYD